jgi:hypothetical protein
MRDLGSHQFHECEAVQFKQMHFLRLPAASKHGVSESGSGNVGGGHACLFDTLVHESCVRTSSSFKGGAMSKKQWPRKLMSGLTLKLKIIIGGDSCIMAETKLKNAGNNV